MRPTPTLTFCIYSGPPTRVSNPIQSEQIDSRQKLICGIFQFGCAKLENATREISREKILSRECLLKRGTPTKKQTRLTQEFQP